ncbi:phospholipase A2 inhibitor PIP [Liasis olivaceus]
MKSLQTICLLFIFIARGTSRKCETCHGFGDDCDGYQEECPSPEDQCGKILIDVALAPISFRATHKNCFSSSICKLGRVDVHVWDGVYMRGRTNCCDNDQCEDQPLPGLPLSLQNGLYCPGAFGIFTDDSTEHEVKCRGTETMCLDLVGYRQENFAGNITYNIKGCVSSCPLVTLSERGHEGRKNDLKKIECREALKYESSD